MTEKDLPFRIYSSELPGWWVEDVSGKTIAKCATKDQADFIILACNKYFGQRERVEELEGAVKEAIDCIDSDTPLEGAALVTLQRAALAKGDTNESE